VQFFCGEAVFRRDLPFDRSSLTRWRQRPGEEHLTALLQERLSMAHDTGALAAKDLARVAVDTTFQPKAVANTTNARLMYRAPVKLVDLARSCGVRLRQSYRRVAKHAAIRIGRYLHAHQSKRVHRELRFLRFLRARIGR
jgi:IS5 family transposase